MTAHTIPAQSSFATASQVKTPAHQAVYESLRAMILFGDLAPGQPVTIQGLVQDLGAGMTPVREALRRLVAEGALSLQGNRRVSVPVLTPAGVDELGFMRQALEPELARRAATQITRQRLDRLRQIDTDLNTAIAQGDIGGYLTQNYRFHTCLYEGADAPIMAATVDRLWLRFGPSLRVVCGWFGTSNLPDKHAALLDALERQDVDAAAQALSEDVAQGIKQVREALATSQLQGASD